MAPASVHLDGERGRTRGDRAGPGEEGAARAGPHMGGVGGDRAFARHVEYAFLQHERSSAETFFSGLEHEHDIACEIVAVCVQQVGGPHEPGRVQVVAAGVHGAVGRPEGYGGRLSCSGRASMSARSRTVEPGRANRWTATTV